MTDDVNLDKAFEGLSPEEAKRLTDLIRESTRAAIQSHQAEKQAAAKSQVQSQYETERNAIMQKGLNVDARIRALTDLKNKFRARGLQL